MKLLTWCKNSRSKCDAGRR